MRTLISAAGTYTGLPKGVFGTFVRMADASVAFCIAVGRDAETKVWVPVTLPNRFRTQQDVNSTLDMLGGRKSGRSYSANIVSGVSSIGYKQARLSDDGEGWTLGEMVLLGKLSKEDLAGIHKFYEL